MIITKEYTIEKIFSEFPALKFQMITALSSVGIKCAGVGAELNKSLDELLSDQSVAEKLIQELNLLVPKSDDVSVLTVSAIAKEKIEQYLSSQKKKDLGFKLGLKPGGCSGFEYIMRFDEAPGVGDKVYKIDGIQFFISDIDYSKLKGSMLDYKDELMDSGFRIVNPNATGSCGCGVSNSF